MSAKPHYFEDHEADPSDLWLTEVWDLIMALHTSRGLANLKTMKMWEVELPDGWSMVINGTDTPCPTSLLSHFKVPPYEFAAIKDEMPWIIAHPLHGVVFGPNFDAMTAFCDSLRKAITQPPPPTVTR